MCHHRRLGNRPRTSPGPEEMRMEAEYKHHFLFALRFQISVQIVDIKEAGIICICSVSYSIWGLGGTMRDIDTLTCSGQFLADHRRSHQHVTNNRIKTISTSFY